ncbi:MAG: hypothetical protein ACK58T_24280, partial [Phycisphaerae bacterium]
MDRSRGEQLEHNRRRFLIGADQNSIKEFQKRSADVSILRRFVQEPNKIASSIAVNTGKLSQLVRKLRNPFCGLFAEFRVSLFTITPKQTRLPPRHDHKLVTTEVLPSLLQQTNVGIVVRKKRFNRLIELKAAGRRYGGDQQKDHCREASIPVSDE